MFRRLDELLTGSALLAASTGEASWRSRYDENLPILDAALARAQEYATPKSGNVS